MGGAKRVQNRITALQALRAIAFLGIFFSHSHIKYFMACGSWGVSIFLVLSGFLMTYSYYYSDRITQSNLISDMMFAIRKIGRLYRLHIFTMILAIPYFVVTHYKSGMMRGLINLTVKTISNVLLIQSWIPDSRIYYSLNGVAWYLSVTVFLFFIFPSILIRLRNYRSIKQAIASLAITIIIQIGMAYYSYEVANLLRLGDQIHRWFVYIFPLSRLEDFFIGCNLGYIFLNFNFEKISNAWFSLFEIITILLISGEIYFVYNSLISLQVANQSSEVHFWWSETTIYTASTGAIVFLFAINRGICSKALDNKYIVWLGDISSTAFLFHQLVIKYLDIQLFGKINELLETMIAIIITIICTVVWNNRQCIKNEKGRAYN